MIILVSGTRHLKGSDIQGRRRVISTLDAWAPKGCVLRHGNAEGVDRIAAQHAEAMGWGLDPYPAQWQLCGPECPNTPHRTRYGCPLAGPRRNSAMVTNAPRPDYVIAFPLVAEQERGGTWDLIRKAVRFGLAVNIVPLRLGDNGA